MNKKLFPLVLKLSMTSFVTVIYFQVVSSVNFWWSRSPVKKISFMYPFSYVFSSPSTLHNSKEYFDCSKHWFFVAGMGFFPLFSFFL